MRSGVLGDDVFEEIAARAAAGRNSADAQMLIVAASVAASSSRYWSARAAEWQEALTGYVGGGASAAEDRNDSGEIGAADVEGAAPVPLPKRSSAAESPEPFWAELPAESAHPPARRSRSGCTTAG